jgi:hypothetical protein
MIFMQPQRLVVPLFQRPYVWTEENQWEPLWNDVTRVAERVLQDPGRRHHPHFLGAIVLQQVQKPTGQMQERTIIDGQQRLTTLQILLDALHAELHAVGSGHPAMRLEALVRNPEPFCTKPEDRFKVWPTNRDRPAFNAVMSADPPVDHSSLGFNGRIVDAHRYFTERAREWLAHAPERPVAERAAAIETAARDLLQVVVIDLAADENAQEIFETLNARGAQLTAADLIKNFIFQRLLESGADVERVYQERWRDLESGFWEVEINVGRVRYHRSSIFLNHWLIARTGEEVVAREVFERFKRFADHDAQLPMSTLIARVHAASCVYRDFVSAAAQQTGAIDRLGLFGYRTGVLESEVIKPLVLYLLDPEEPAIPATQLQKALDVIESWMVRRMLIRATTKNYNQVVADLISHLRTSDRMVAGDVIERFLAAQSSESRYWPDDTELRDELDSLVAYRRLGGGRVRMVLEAVEDHLRGWRDGREGLGGQRVARGTFGVEHVMPRKWGAHWPLPPGTTEAERDRLIHTFGNLTLVTKRLNSALSNGPWLGVNGKRRALEAHDVLLLNRELLKSAGDEWTNEMIRARTRATVEAILGIWPVPLGHKSGFVRETPRVRRKLQVGDLVAGGALAAGTILFPRIKPFRTRIATVLPDGLIDVDGIAYARPSDAARAIANRPINGWAFFLVDQTSRKSLRDVRSEYVNAMSVDAEDDEPDDEGDED